MAGKTDWVTRLDAGLGYEISSVGRPGLLRPENKTYIRFVRTLGARGVIRIEGNTFDYASRGTPAGGISAPIPAAGVASVVRPEVG